MSRHYIERDGKPVPCGLMEWARWFENADRALGQTEVGGSQVSTVFMGLDHRFDPKGPPLLYETLVFGGPLEDDMDRYSTREEALAGHKAMVARCHAIEEPSP